MRFKQLYGEHFLSINDIDTKILNKLVFASISSNLNYPVVSRIPQEYQQFKASFNTTGKLLKKTEKNQWEQARWQDNLSII